MIHGNSPLTTPDACPVAGPVGRVRGTVSWPPGGWPLRVSPRFRAPPRGVLGPDPLASLSVAWRAHTQGGLASILWGLGRGLDRKPRRTLDLETVPEFCSGRERRFNGKCLSHQGQSLLESPGTVPPDSFVVARLGDAVDPNRVGWRGWYPPASAHPPGGAWTSHVGKFTCGWAGPRARRLGLGSAGVASGTRGDGS